MRRHSYLDELEEDFYEDHFDLENFDEEYLNLEKIKAKHNIGRRKIREARRSIEEYLELKRLERENRDLFDQNFLREE